MLWFIRLLKETADYIDINYSFEENRNLDGIIRYHKSDDKFETIKMSEGSNEFSNQRLFPHLYNSIDSNQVTEKMKVIATG